MIDDELREIWRDAKPRLLQRCASVRDAATAPEADIELDAVARSDSHKLAGTVGMFGLVDASALAKELDALVSGDALDDGRRRDVAVLAEALADAIEQER
ncbi:MAG TPA: Hpt domain-containing protein [Acidimicrobiales bacterium]|nr:Hpt domain-containing protein [Acidimicrobiales bacterium]